MTTDIEFEFINPAHATTGHEFVVMERFGTTWGTVAMSTRESREAAESALAALNAMLNAKIRRLETKLATLDDPNEIASWTRHLASVRDTEYAIFERTISAFTRA